MGRIRARHAPGSAQARAARPPVETGVSVVRFLFCAQACVPFACIPTSVNLAHNHLGRYRLLLWGDSSCSRPRLRSAAASMSSSAHPRMPTVSLPRGWGLRACSSCGTAAPCGRPPDLLIKKRFRRIFLIFSIYLTRFLLIFYRKSLFFTFSVHQAHGTSRRANEAPKGVSRANIGPIPVIWTKST